MELDEFTREILRELKEYVDTVLENNIIDAEFVGFLEEKAKQIRRIYEQRLSEEIESIEKGLRF